MAEQLGQVLLGMAEIYGKSMTEFGAKLLAADLAGYPEDQILSALARCRKELRTFPTVADILARLEDGRPGSEEAWALIPQDEAGSVIWSDEMAEAFGVARHLLAEGDPIAARQAFKECYQQAVIRARSERKPARFTPSFGHDQQGRMAALREALDKKRITEDQAQALLPDYAMPESQLVLESDSDRPAGLTNISEIIKRLEDKREAAS